MKTKMNEYVVQFVVQASNIKDALNQGERYLNTGNRCVDMNVMELKLGDNHFKPLTKPATAKRAE